MSDDYSVWFDNNQEMMRQLVKHCDKKIDAYHAEHAKRQKRMIAETRKHNAVVEKYLAAMVKLIGMMGRKK